MLDEGYEKKTGKSRAGGVEGCTSNESAMLPVKDVEGNPMPLVSFPLWVARKTCGADPRWALVYEMESDKARDSGRGLCDLATWRETEEAYGYRKHLRPRDRGRCFRRSHVPGPGSPESAYDLLPCGLFIKDGITRVVNGLKADDHAKSPSRKEPRG
jgi:hypothetical protein